MGLLALIRAEVVDRLERGLQRAHLGNAAQRLDQVPVVPLVEAGPDFLLDRLAVAVVEIGGASQRSGDDVELGNLPSALLCRLCLAVELKMRDESGLLLAEEKAGVNGRRLVA